MPENTPPSLVILKASNFYYDVRASNSNLCLNFGGTPIYLRTYFTFGELKSSELGIE